MIISYNENEALKTKLEAEQRQKEERRGYLTQIKLAVGVVSVMLFVLVFGTVSLYLNVLEVSAELWSLVVVLCLIAVIIFSCIMYGDIKKNYSVEPQYSFATKYYIAGLTGDIAEIYFEDVHRPFPSVYVVIREQDGGVSRKFVGVVKKKEYFNLKEPVLDIDNARLKVPKDFNAWAALSYTKIEE